MIFICTCSQDRTTDLLLPYLKDTPAFRFNIDRREDFAWDFSKRDFKITDIKQGIEINSKSLTSFYLRKPMYFEQITIPPEGCLENWCREETDYVFEELYHWCEAAGKVSLVRSRSDRYGKLRQMLVAENYFRVADWHIFQGMLPDDLTRGKWVVKSLSGAAPGKGKVFFVKEVEPAELDVHYPWFLQEKIDGEDEVTVVYIAGKTIAYRYPRSSITDCDDVRKAIFDNRELWVKCELSSAEQSAIRGFMDETGYRFGRFDFIRKDGELWFLELNPNGQWAWLDIDNQDGLISAIAEQILSEDRQHREVAADLRSSL